MSIANRIIGSLFSRRRIERQLDKLAEETGKDLPRDSEPVILIGGRSPPKFSDKFPHQYHCYRAVKTSFSREIVYYQPRAWQYDSGTFILHDWSNDTQSAETQRFTLRIDPDEYISYRIVRPHPDGSIQIERPPSR